MEEKRTKDNSKSLTIRISIEQYDKIKKLAEESERDVSKQIRYILDKYLDMIKK